MPGTRLTELTLTEVKQRQRAGFLFACGRYQGIPNTLAGFTNNNSENAKFDKTAQDNFALWLINQRAALKTYIYGGSYRAGIDQHLSDACLDGAQIWASLPVRVQTTRTDNDGTTKTIQAGQAYYGGVGVNKSKAKVSLSEYVDVLNKCRAAKNATALLNLIARAEVGTDLGVGYDVVNAGRNGEVIPLPGSENYLNRIQGISDKGSTRHKPDGTLVSFPGSLRGSANGDGMGGRSTTSTASTESAPSPPSREELSTAYIQKTYLDAFRQSGVPDTVWPNLKPSATSTFELFLRDPTNIISGEQDLNGEIYLLTGITNNLAELAGQVSTVLGKLQGFTPAEQYLLLSEKLFEFFPDDMRNRMLANAGSGLINTSPHAWRAPGKVAITADITIPGASGFRIGEVFWIGRTYENFKNFGVFQLFGLTETIDVNRGWTTQLYSRFNAIPQPIMENQTSI